MNVRKKKYVFCAAAALLLICSGCGKPMDAKQMRVIKNGYLIGTVGEEYYRLTIRAYSEQKPLPPITSLHKPRATTIEKFCYQLDCYFCFFYLKFFPDRETILTILQ